MRYIDALISRFLNFMFFSDDWHSVSSYFLLGILSIVSPFCFILQRFIHILHSSFE